jgi:glutathione S-transferase
VFDRIGDFGVPSHKPKVAAWRKALAARPSIRQAVGADYEIRLERFLAQRNSHLSTLMP